MNGLPTLRQRVGYRAADEAAVTDGLVIWGRVDAGFGQSETPHTTTFSTRSDDLYAFNLDTSLDNPIDSYQLTGRIGVRVKW